jgi:predicted ATPase
VKELGPVIVLLQRSALSGAALAIDEPECSLHPQAQVELAKVLVELVSRDARFLLSTHSPYLAQSLSNEWVRRSREGSLSGKSMSVVSFANSGKGFGAKSLQYHESYGFEFEEFVDTADSVQSQFAELFE